MHSPDQTRLKDLLWPLMILTGLSFVITLVVLPLAIRLDDASGLKLCLLAGGTCYFCGLCVLALPVLFPVAEPYVMVLTLGFGVRMLFPLIACGVMIREVGVEEARVFAICLLIISPVLLFWETWMWTRRLSETNENK